jgi:hypothetical protein
MSRETTDKTSTINVSSTLVIEATTSVFLAYGKAVGSNLPPWGK